MHRSLNYLAGIGYATIFGFSFLVTKEALSALDPLELLALRFSLAALIMTLLVAARAVRVDYRGKPIRLLAAACLFQPLLYFASETLGVRESASSTAGMVLGALLPAAVSVLGAVMLHERLSRRQGASLVLSIAGVAVIVLLGAGGEGGTGTLRGFLFLLGAVASAALFNIFSKKGSAHFTPVETTFAMMWSAAIVYGGLAAARGLLSANAAAAPLAADGVGYAARLAESLGAFMARAAPAWPGIVYLGALSSVLAFFFVNFTLARLKASQSIVFANLVTVISVAAGVAIRGEPFGPTQLAGSIMIVVGVWGTNAPDRREAGRPEPSRGKTG